METSRRGLGTTLQSCTMVKITVFPAELSQAYSSPGEQAGTEDGEAELK